MDSGRRDAPRANRDALLSSSATRSPAADFENITINNQLVPQAASTVQRKYGRQTRSSEAYQQNNFFNFQDAKMPREFSSASSLGILDIDNMTSISEYDEVESKKSSNIANERKLARDLLQKCNRQSSEENKNSILLSSTLVNKEITNSMESDQSSTNSMMEGISMSSSTANAMAQYADGEFQEFNSKLAEQFQAERGFSFDASAPPIPDISTFDELNMLSDLKLIEVSENASLVSFGDYCKKKTGAYGSDWSNLDALSSRPSIGLGQAESPEKKGPIRRLYSTTSTDIVDMTNDSKTLNQTTKTGMDNASDIYHVNLQSIARILNAKNTPRTVIDKLLEMNKRACLTRAQETYIMNDDTLVDMQRPEKDTSVMRAEKFESFERESNGVSPSLPFSKGFSMKNSLGNQTPVNLTEDQSTLQLTPSAVRFEERNHTTIASSISPRLARDATDAGFEVDISNLKQSVNKSSNKSGELQENDLENNGSMTLKSPRDKGRILVRTKSQEVTICLVGVPTKAEIEVTNNSARWILVSANLYQIQGDKDYVELRIPEEIILIKPSDIKSIKIGVRIKKICKPIMMSMLLEMTDMVTREKWTVNHLMCFIPEENSIQILGPSENDELSFGDVAEDDSKNLSISIDNKNNIDITVEMQIIQNEPPVFFIENSDETLKTNETLDGVLRMSVKSKESLTTNVEFRGLLLETMKDSNRKISQNLCSIRGKLLITIFLDGNVELMAREIPLSGRIGTVKIEPCHTPAVVIVAQNQSKSVYFRNNGSIAVELKSSIVRLNETGSESTYEVDRNFVLTPDSFVIEPGAKGCVLVTYSPKNVEENEWHSLMKFTSGNKVSTYPIVGIKRLIGENGQEQFNRCETPQNSKRTISPSSPQSAEFNGSLHSGRNSPGSSCGGSSVTGDVIPIRATHSALNWGSIRAGRREIKEFTIRNMSSHKLKLVATIEGPDRSFKFSREGYGTISTMSISLQSFETKTLFVAFEPHDTGACVGKIIFNFYAHKRGNIEGRPTKIIQLSGYCGYAKLDILETLRDMSGQLWLSLGNLNNGGFLEAKLRLKNNGDLACYAKIDILPKIVNPDVHLTWQVSPRECLIEPKEIRCISVFFKPKKKDLDLLRHFDSSYVGALKITHGDEPSRLRFRRLYMKLEKSGDMEKRDDAFKGVISSLCRVFPGEKPISDLGLMRDSTHNLNELCRGINEHEIKLTLETNMEETESIMTDTLDDTATFHSLLNGSCNDVTLM